MDMNKEKVITNVEQILKSFHIFWNILRSRNDIDKARVDTKEVVKQLIYAYRKREKSLYLAT